MKLQEVKWMISWECIYLHSINFVEKGIVYLDCWRKKPQFQFSLIESRNEVFDLDLLSNILDVSYAVFHLVKKKTTTTPNL